LKPYEQIIDIYGNKEKVAIESLKYHVLKGFDVEIITIISGRHYQLILYKNRKVEK
jgi:hypothetical protein